MCAHVVCATYTSLCIMQMLPSSLRFSFLPEMALPWALILASCPLKELVDACPPVLEYTCVSSTSTLISAPAASMRDSDWNPMSSIAPSPPIIHSRLSFHPNWSQRARTPMASAGAFSNSELVHETRYGLYGYVDVYTVLQPVAATMPTFSWP